MLQPLLLNSEKKRRMEFNPKEYKLVCLRECPMPEEQQLIDTPERAAAYWRQWVESSPNFNPEVESFVVLFLNTRRRVKGHKVISTGTLDTLLVHPREAFRDAIVAASAAVIYMHSHPSGDPLPSEADIKVTRDLMRAGQLLKIDLVDHVIMGARQEGTLGKFCSLRELGYLYAS